MIATRADLARHFRFITGTAIAVLIATFLYGAPPAHAADHWSGVWETHHKFSDPKLRLELDERKGPDRLTGRYENTDGSRGTVKGEVTKVAGDQVWTGNFKDDGENLGKFRVVLLADNASFAGWFKICDDGDCSKKYKWTGDRVGG